MARSFQRELLWFLTLRLLGFTRSCLAAELPASLPLHFYASGITIMASPTRVTTGSGAPQPGAFNCVMGDRHIFRINRCGALQPAAAACRSCEPG